jgi:hypoxanthine-DNA glycosylase
MLSHPLPPLAAPHCHTLILGTFPSVKSRETRFFYGHPQNRFWRVMAGIFGAETPESVGQKTELLLSRGIALWDVVASCDIRGSSDASISGVAANDIAGLISGSRISRVFTNGATAHRLYNRHCLPSCGLADTPLPSTSAANASFSLPRLIEAWSAVAG